MFFVFVALIVGPIVAGKFIDGKSLPNIPMDLMQPSGLNNNDTTNEETGAGNPFANGGGAAETGTGGASTTDAAGAAATEITRRMLRYMAY